jgi:hypothetical protein
VEKEPRADRFDPHSTALEEWLHAGLAKQRFFSYQTNVGSVIALWIQVKEPRSSPASARNLTKIGPIELDRSDQMLLEEYKALRGEVIYWHAENLKYATYTVASSAILYSWMSANAVLVKGKFIVWFPLLFAVIYASRSISASCAMKNLGVYLRRIEKAFYDDQELGWERFIKTGRVSHSQTISAIVFIGGYLLFSIYLSCALYWGT